VEEETSRVWRRRGRGRISEEDLVRAMRRKLTAARVMLLQRSQRQERMVKDEEKEEKEGGKERNRGGVGGRQRQ
jgi:hypothetical protein